MNSSIASGIVGLDAAWRLAARAFRQAVCIGISLGDA